MQKTFYLLITLVIFGNALCFSQVREGSKEGLQQAVDYAYTENYKEALAVLKNLLELSTPQEQETVFYTQVLSEWIKVYSALNNSQAALPALKKAQNYVKEHLRDQHLLLARYKNLEGEVWMGSNSARSLQLAVGYFKDAEALIVKSNFKDPELNQHIMLNIVNTDTRLGDYDDAENYIQKAFDQVQAQNGTALDIVPFAVPYVRILELKNMYAEALEILTTIRSILESNRTHSYYNSYYFTVLDQFTNLYTSTGDFQKAIQNLESQIALIEESVGKDTQTYLVKLRALGKLYLKEQDYENTVAIYLESNVGLLKQIEQTFQFTGESQKQKYLQSLTEYFNEILSLSDELTIEYPELTISALNCILTIKGLVLNSSKAVIRSLKYSKEPEILNQLELFQTYNDSIARLHELPYGAYTFLIQDLEKERDAIGAALNRLYYDGKANEPKFLKDWKVIQRKLNTSEIAIEFARYTVLDDKTGQTIDEQYVAFLIKKEWTYPRRINVFRLEDFKTLFNTSPQELFASRGSRVAINKTKALNYERAYDLIWGNIAPFLEGINHIYYAPDGILHQVPFAALTTRVDSSLSHKYDLTQLVNTSDIKSAKGLNTIESAILYGGINYDYPLEADQSGNYTYIMRQTNTEFDYTKNEDLVVSKWNSLPGTRTELDSIIRILENEGLQFKSLTDENATEASFKHLNGNSPQLIHLATHGFFYNRALPRVVIQERHNNPYLYSDNKLMHSGLLFAGANFSWEYGSNPFKVENGILSALEISHLDLSNTKIAILSACETGLGFIEGSEGVYGLKRAFKMAGVDTLILSLWQVPDKETAEFMQLFYRFWITDKTTVHKAFRKAQQQMRVVYEKEPYNWAAFVLLE